MRWARITNVLLSFTLHIKAVFYKSCCVKVENESLNSLALVLMIFSMVLL
jgi:hypothetical protein